MLRTCTAWMRSFEALDLLSQNTPHGSTSSNKHQVSSTSNVEYHTSTHPSPHRNQNVESDIGRILCTTAIGAIIASGATPTSGWSESLIAQLETTLQVREGGYVSVCVCEACDI